MLKLLVAFTLTNSLAIAVYAAVCIDVGVNPPDPDTLAHDTLVPLFVKYFQMGPVE